MILLALRSLFTPLPTTSRTDITDDSLSYAAHQQLNVQYHRSQFCPMKYENIYVQNHTYLEFEIEMTDSSKTSLIIDPGN